MSNAPIWATAYPKHRVPIFMGKRYKHTADLLAGLAIKGPCTTRDIAKHVLENTPDYEYRPVRAGNLAKIYNNLINDRGASKKRWSGLLTQKYVIKVDERLNEKDAKTYVYTLTLKGCFVALGYEFTDDELTSFIKNVARNNMYFAYINKILAETSISFVKAIFIHSIQTIMKKGRIFLDDDINFYFSNIADITGTALYQRYIKVLNADYDRIKESVHAEIESMKDIDSLDMRDKFWLESSMVTREYHRQTVGKPIPKDEEIDTLMKKTFYAQINFDDWIDRMTNYFYPNSDDLEFHTEYSDGNDKGLLYRVMQEIHHSYFNVFSMGTPKFTNRLPPNSKRWKLHYRNNKQSLMMKKKLIAG